MDKRAPGEKRYSITATSAAAAGDMRQRSYSADHGMGGGASSPTSDAGGGGSVDRSRERQLVGSLSDSYKFRADGLIKKTMSIVVNGVAQHLISYYHPNDVLQGNLRSPTSVPELASLEISPELLVKQNFRIPPMVEPAYDRHGNETSQLSPLTPPESLTGSYGGKDLYMDIHLYVFVDCSCINIFIYLYLYNYMVCSMHMLLNTHVYIYIYIQGEG